MTGTACELNETTPSKDQKNIELLTSWLFGKINPECHLIEITHCGASILIPTEKNLSSESFNLLLMRPEDQNQILGIVNAELRWIDKDYSTTHNRLGLEFNHYEDETKRCIDETINHITQHSNHMTMCSLLSR